MRSSTFATRHGSGGTEMLGTGAFRLSPTFLSGPARLARRTARLPGFARPFRGGRAAHAGMPIPGARASRGPGALALLAALVFLLPAAETARAETFVSNLGQSKGGLDVGSFDIAQEFTTGSNTGGYFLYSVTIPFIKTPSGLTVKVGTGTAQSIAGKSGTACDSLADDSCVTLTNPSSLAVGNLTFTAPAGTELSGGSPGTDYFVVIQAATGEASRRESGGEEVKAAGWSIANEIAFRTAGMTGSFTTNTEQILRLRVDGKAITGPAAPPAPTLSIEAATELKARWSAPADNGGRAVNDYDLRWRASGAATWTLRSGDTNTHPDTTLTTATEATITGLTTIQIYFVQVRANNAVGKGAWSASSILALRATGAPGTPTLNTVSTTVLLARWPRPVEDRNSEIRDYDVRHREKGSSTWTADATTDPHDPATHRRITGLTAGKTYEVQVRANNVVGSGSWSPSAFGSTLATAAPSQDGVSLAVTTACTATTGCPAVPTATAAPGPGVGQITVNWTHGTPSGGEVAATHWRVSHSLGSDTVPGSFIDAATTKHTLTGLTPGAEYTITLLAIGSEFDLHARVSATVRAGTGRNPSLDPPTVELVRIVSVPSNDVSGDGTVDTYIRRDRILVDVEFSEPVEVANAGTNNANVKLRLDLGPDALQGSNTNTQQRAANRKVANLESVLNGGRTLRFAYQVKASDTDADGVWVQTTSPPGNLNVIQLTGSPAATITGADSGRTAILAKSGLPTTGDAMAKVDGSVQTSPGPKPQGATVNGSTLVVTFNKALKTALDQSRMVDSLRVHVSSVHGGHRNASLHPDRVSASGTRLTLTLPSAVAVQQGDRVTLSYGGLGRLQDTLGNAAALFQDLAVTNNTGSAGAPVAERADVAGTSLRVVFDKALQTAGTPPGSAFTVHASDNDLGARAIAGTGTTVVTGSSAYVTLASAVRPDELVSVSYAKPGSGSRLAAGAAGNAAVESFDRFRVETVHDTTAPTLADWWLSEKGNAQNPPLRSRLVLTFNEPLDPVFVPAPGDFAMTGGTSIAFKAGTVVVAGNGVGIETVSRVSNNTTGITLTYTPGTVPLRDRAGNDVAGFTETISERGGGQPNPGASRTVNGEMLTVALTAAVDPASVPPGSAFTLHYPLASGETAADRAPYPNRVVAATPMRHAAEPRNRVELRLANPVSPCEGASPFTVSFAQPSNAPGLVAPSGWGGNAWEHLSVTNELASQCRTSRPSSWIRETPQTSGGSPKSVTLDFGRGLNRAKTLAAADFSVERSAGSAGSGGSGGSAPSVEDVSFTGDGTGVTLELSRALGAGETAVVGYTWPRSGQGLWDTAGNQLDSFSGVEVRGAEAEEPVLSVADAGAGEGGTLAFAVTLDEAAAGEVTVDYATADGTAAAGDDYTAASGTLAFAAGETAKTVSVALLHDAAADDGETLTLTLSNPSGATIGDGEATGTVADVAPLTASLHGLPEEHDGTAAFAFEVRFSDEFEGLALTAFAAGALQVANGEVVDATRAVAGENRRVTLRVRPAGYGDVTLTLAAATDCAAQDAVCAGDGRKLSGTATATVLGPLVITVTGGEAREGVDRGIEFELSLSRYATEKVSVDYTTVDGTATAGEDYTAMSGTMEFFPGFRRVWVGVPILDQGLDEGNETFSLRLSGARGAPIAVAEAVGTVLDAAPVALPVLPVLSVADARGDEGETLAFAVTLDKAAAGAVTVDWATADGTANAGADYSAAAGTLAFAAGETEKTVSVALLHDGSVDDGETFTLTLSNASGATIGDGEATGTVADVAPLTATFHGLPSEHDGRKLFGFEVRFSEEFRGLSLAAFKAGALRVTNGRVVDAKRTVRGRNRSVTVRVRPSGVDDMTLTLPAVTDCAAASAICTHDGRKLSGTVTASVRGPVAVSVADARASEGADAAVAFAVTLNRAASGEVTVDYATRDGTATAGEDYTATRGTLTFAVGDTGKTVEVPILDDALDEGEETFTLKLTGARGAAIDDGEATGTIENSDPLQTMWLSRFGRTVADHVTAAVSDRLSNPLTGAQVTVGGQSVDLAETDGEARLGATLTALAQLMGAAPSGPGPEDDGWPGTGLGAGGSAAPARLPSGRALLLGSTFHLAAEGDGGGPGLAAWGRVSAGGFDGEAPADGGNVRIDGEVMTGVLGADAEWDRLLAGVALSVSEGEGSFDQPGVDAGTVESTMTTVSPYGRLRLSDRVSTWGLVGVGTGDMTLVQAANGRGQPERVTRTDLSMRLAAVGGRGALLTPGAGGGFDLALKADAFFVETTSEAVSGEGDTSADASRVRLVLEGSRAFTTGGGGVFTPGLELGLRHDGGDAETGTGVELGGRVTYADAASGLSLEANVRALVAHEDTGYEEWGASGALRLAPGERGRGLSFSLAPAYGAPGSGIDRLWSARDAGGLRPGGGTFEPESRLAGELGYGVALFGGGFTGTPNLGFGLSSGGRDYRVGWRLTSAGASGFEVNLDATRREPANESGAAAPAEHGVMLRGALRW